MKIKIFIILFAFSAIVKAQEKAVLVPIDVNKTDKVKLSYFAKDVIAIPIKNHKSLTIVSISNVILTNNCLFIRANCEESDNMPRFLKYTLDGRFIKEIGTKNEMTGDLVRLHYAFPIPGKQEILLKFPHHYSIFDFDGNLMYRKVCERENVILSPLYNGFAWALSLYIDIENAKKVNFLVKYNPYGFNLDTLYIASGKLNEREKSYKRFGYPLPSIELPTTWAINDDNLYLNLALQDAILKIDKNDKVRIAYKFKLENILDEKINRITYPKRFILNNLIFFGYNISHQDYYYIFDVNKETGFNFKTGKGQYGRSHSGIIDDIYNTGYINLNKRFNSELFYFRDSRDLSEQNIKAKRNSNITLFIIKQK